MADWYSVSGATEYDFSIALQGGSPTFYYNITRTYKDFPSGDLGYGSTYELRVRACNNYGCSPYSNLSLLTTRPKRPSLSTSIAGTTLSVVVTGLTGNYTDVTVYLRDSSGTELQSKTATYNNQTVTFTLSPNTDYKVNGRTRLYVHQTNLYSNYTTLISASVQKPSLWYWTTAETNAFNNNGLVTVLTYTRWNSFIDKVNEFRTYAGKSSIGGKIYSSNKTLTAVKFVTVAQGIRDMTSYLAVELTQVQQGDIVWGWYFPHLSSRLDYV